MAISIDAEGLERLKRFVLDSFEQTDNLPSPLIGSNYGQNDAFFEARGYFNALMGCNTWTAAALRQGGTDLRFLDRVAVDAAVVAAPA